VIYLADNDIIEKLAVCDLLDDALVAFAASRRDVFVLNTLKFRIGGRSQTKAENRLGTAAVARLLEFLAGVQEIREFSTDDVKLLDDVVGIDPGETILLAATAIHSDYLLLTGDKRCLRTLATVPECESIARRIQGRVVCFEQTILRLIARFGFDHVLRKVVGEYYRDTALRAAFGSGIQSTQSNSVACLQSYIDELRRLPFDLLATL
jgi:hypothetical protein